MPKARQRLQQALAIAQADYPLGLSPIHACLGEVMAAMGDDDQAGDYLDCAVESARAAECPWFISYSQNKAGFFYLQRHDLRNAKAAFEESRRMSSDLNTPDALATSLFGLAKISAREGNRLEAKRLGFKSLSTLREITHFKADEVERWLRLL